MSENTARTFAQKASSYTKDTLEKSKTAAEDTTKVVEQSYITASTGAFDFNLQLIDIAQTNMNAAFDLARELSQAKSPSEFLELSAGNSERGMFHVLEPAPSCSGTLSAKSKHKHMADSFERYNHCLPGWGASVLALKGADGVPSIISLR